MNRFVKYEKIIFALILVFALAFAIAIPVCAEAMQNDNAAVSAAENTGGSSATSGGSVLADPMFYIFLATVAGFIGLVVGGIFLYLKFTNIKKEHKYADHERTIQIYDDLEDVKWADVPDTVFIETTQPPAAILSDVQPVEPIRGLEGLLIKETHIDPIQAINMGAEPYAKDAVVTNTVFEANVQTTSISEDDLRPDEPVRRAEEPQYDALNYQSNYQNYQQYL